MVIRAKMSIQKEIAHLSLRLWLFILLLSAWLVSPTYWIPHLTNKIDHIFCRTGHYSLTWLYIVFFACCIATKAIPFYTVSTSFASITSAFTNYIVSLSWVASVASLPPGADFEDVTLKSLDEKVLICPPFFKGLGLESITMVCWASDHPLLFVTINFWV